MELRDQVLACVKTKGPVLPMQVAKDIARDTFYAGAILSELLNHKVIKISNAKIGGSPVYYMPGQEERLQMLYNGLPQREKEAYNLLKEKKVMRDKDLAPAHRVAMRMIKDFALPSYDQQQNIVWRWYLHQPEKKQIQPVIMPKQPTVIPQTVLQATVPQQPRKPETPQQKAQAIKKEAPDAFINNIRSYLMNNHIQVIEEKMTKRHKEMEIIAKVPSNVGLLEYLIIAKNKKKIADSDLSLAHNQGQAKKMPVMLLTNGELSKKAQEYKERNLKGFMIIKRL
jgi:CRISPR/Cas system CMR-associated protein Cmr5 small subunit